MFQRICAFGILVFAFSVATFAEGYCTTDANCSGHGVCVSNQCHCFPGYIEGDSPCSYVQNKQATAFTLSVMPWTFIFGSARFYIGDKLAGGFQAGLTGLAVIMGSIAKGSDGRMGDTAGVIAGLASAAMAVWWIVDTAMFGANAINDGNGEKLENW